MDKAKGNLRQPTGVGPTFSPLLLLLAATSRHYEAKSESEAGILRQHHPLGGSEAEGERPRQRMAHHSWKAVRRSC